MYLKEDQKHYLCHLITVSSIVFNFLFLKLLCSLHLFYREKKKTSLDYSLILGKGF